MSKLHLKTSLRKIWHEHFFGSRVTFCNIAPQFLLDPFNRYLSIGRWNKKKITKISPFIFEFCLWEDPPHPVNWSPSHSTGPQTLFSTDISVSVAQIKKIEKTISIYLHFCTFSLFLFIFPKCIYPKCICAKCTRLACLLSFASLFFVWCVIPS